jgi:hypothetical protein
MLWRGLWTLTLLPFIPSERFLRRRLFVSGVVVEERTAVSLRFPSIF